MPLIVRMQSGAEHLLSRVKLYHAELVAQIEALRVQAQTKLGGVSTGIGFIGSPEWVLGGSALIGALETALSKSAQKEGIRLLQQMEKLSLTLQYQGAFFPVEEIEHISVPLPSTWAATGESVSNIDTSGMHYFERRDFIEKHKIQEGDIQQDGWARVRMTGRHIHDGSAFLNAETDEGQIRLRWTSVESVSALS